MTKVLKIDRLQTHFHIETGVVQALNGINLSVERGETAGLVGETGSGKSVTAKSVIQLIPSPPGEIVDGSIRFRGENVLGKSPSETRAIRGSDIAIAFQDLSTSLNPVYIIRNRMIKVVTISRGVSKPEAEDVVHETLEEVEMPRSERVLKSYPRELSGRMKQRMMIVTELTCDSELIIADGSTTALDVIIKKKALSILSKLVEEHNLSVLWITHDLGAIAQSCDRAGVTYAGEIVEFGTVRDVFHRSTHPYTCELLKAIPNVANLKDSLGVIEGPVPNLVNPPPGCWFHPRYPDAEEQCRSEDPPEIRGTNQHESPCLVHEVTDTDHSLSESNSGGK